MSAENHWNQIYSNNPTRIPNENDPMLLTAIQYFGDITGKKLLDLGCGDGRSSLFFAKRGAHVTAIDTSEVAIQNLSQFCLENNISNITPVQCSAFDISDLEPFDFAFGNMILHHLEPFETFAQVLRQSITPSGKAYFRENSSFSNLLVWCRNNLVGKYGIPKLGDDEEFPLTPAEVDIIRQYFSVNIVYPELLFFRLISQYLLKGNLSQVTKKIDDYLFRFEGVRKYSYRQNLFLS